MVMSVVWTGPQVMPSRNGRHSTIGLPLAVCCVSEIVSADDKILSPEDPVSTRIPPIVWQFVVLSGTQTVTLVNAPLMYGELRGAAALGPVLTVMGCTFDTDPPVVPVPDPPPPVALAVEL